MDSGFDLQLASEYYFGKNEDEIIGKGKFDDEILKNAEIVYIKYDNYLFGSVYPIVYSKAGFDLGFDNTADVLAYFVCFDEFPVLLNLYDDRGMEMLSHDKNLIDVVSQIFDDYLIK